MSGVSFGRSLEITSNLLCNDFGVIVRAEGTRFLSQPDIKIIRVPNIRKEMDTVSDEHKFERDAFLGGTLHEVFHILKTDTKFFRKITKKMRGANFKTLRQMYPLMEFYSATEDLRVEALAEREYDGARSLFDKLNMWITDSSQETYRKLFKKIDSLMIKNNKIDLHILRLIAFLVGIEFYYRIRYEKGIKHFKFEKNQKFMSVKMVKSIVKKLMKDKKVIKLVKNIDDIQAPLDAAKRLNKLFHTGLREYFEVVEEEKKVPETKSEKGTKRKGQKDTKESEREETQEDENDNKDTKDESGDKDTEEKKEDIDHKNTDDDNGDNGNGKDDNDEDEYTGGYEFTKENEKEAEKQIEELLTEALVDKSEDYKEAVTSDEEYLDNIYSLFADQDHLSPELFDIKNLLMNQITQLTYYGRSSFEKIPFPPAIQYDSVIEINSEEVLEHIGKRTEEKIADFYSKLSASDKVVAQIKREVYLKLLAKKKMMPRIDCEEGFIDSEKLATYKVDPKIYYELRWKKHYNTAVCYLLDMSKSMARGVYNSEANTFGNEPKIWHLCVTTYILSQITQALGINCEMLGFNNGQQFKNTNSPGQMFLLSEEMISIIAKEGLFGNLNRYYRYGPVNHYIIKSYRDSYEKARNNLYNLHSLVMAPSGPVANVDNEAFEFAAKRLIRMPQKRKIMFLISDGMPNVCLPPNFSELDINNAANKILDYMGKKRKKYKRVFSRQKGNMKHRINFDETRWLANEFVVEDLLKKIQFYSQYFEIGLIGIDGLAIRNESLKYSNILEKLESERKISTVDIYNGEQIGPVILRLLEKLLLRYENT